MKQVEMIKEKHRFKQGVVMRNRAYATLIPGDPDQGVKSEMLAKGSVSPPAGCPDPNAYLINLYLQREAGDKTMTHPFVPVRDQWIKEMDVFRVERETTLNLEYDFKRRPVRPRMMPAGQGMHLAFDTEPWDTDEQAEMARCVFDEWRKKRCLKTMDDFADFDDHLTSAMAFMRLRAMGRRIPVNITKEGSVGLLKRMFLRAYVQGLWGVEKQKKYPEVAAILTELGCVTSVSDVKNASRGIAYERIVPKTLRSTEMMEKLQQAFMGVDASMFFIEETDESAPAQQVKNQN